MTARTADAATRRGPDPLRHSIPRGCGVVYGRRPVTELLRHSPERVTMLFVVSPDVVPIPDGSRIPVKILTREALDALVDVGMHQGTGPRRTGPRQGRRPDVGMHHDGDRDGGPDVGMHHDDRRAGGAVTVYQARHQGVAAAVAPREGAGLDEVVRAVAAAERCLVVIADGIVDPQNLGAVMRAAECFGADWFLRSEVRGAPVGAVAAKSSAGASELLKICDAGNLAAAVEKLKGAGAWVVATAAGEGAEPLGRFRFPEKCVVILGAEGEGVRRLLLERADFRVKIETVGKVESLNVSQAASVVLYAYRRSADRSGTE